MNKLHLNTTFSYTFEQVFNMYIDDCVSRNLRPDTIRHYKQSYLNFKNNFDVKMQINKFNVEHYNQYIKSLKQTISNDVSVNAYLRDYITIIHFAMNNDWLGYYKMQSIKVDQKHVETYTEEELYKLLKKPDIKKCSFMEYQWWVVTSFLFSTAVRQHSLVNIKIKDLDFENNLIYVNVTKNRKQLIIPMTISIKNILIEYLRHRPYKSDEEYLFVNVFGNQLTKGCSYQGLSEYNHRRGVTTTGLHRYRHTFAKQYILNGGNPVILSKLLGHSSLQITQNYINILVADTAKEVNEINLLGKFQCDEKQHIKLLR